LLVVLYSNDAIPFFALQVLELVPQSPSTTLLSLLAQLWEQHVLQLAPAFFVALAQVPELVLLLYGMLGHWF
jgi:hypothetical protein